MKKLILLDGNSIMFRAYYATAYTGNLMKTSQDLYTNAVYGFVNMIQKILTIDEFTHIFVAFDKGKKTFRHQSYSDYKGGRKPMPIEFAMQIPYIKEYLDVLNIKRLETDMYEADDLIGTAAKRFEKDFDEVIVISGDKDLLQLVGGNVKVCLTKKGITELEEYNESNFKDLMGFDASQMVDYKGLIGDSSDNLPGISGVGPKTAVKLLNEYKTLENIIANASNIKGKLSSVIEAEKDTALRTKMLATLETAADIELTLDDILYKEANYSELRQFYEKLEFTSFIKKMNVHTVESNQKSDVEYFYNELDITLDAIKSAKTMCLEVELDQDNYHNANVIGLSIVIDNKGYFLKKSYLDNKELISLLNSDIEVLTIDAKRTYVSLSHLGITLKNVVFDVVLAAYVINPSYSNADIKSVFEHVITTTLPYSEEIYGKKNIYTIPEEEKYAKYSLDKCSYINEFKTKADVILKEQSLTNLLYEVEVPLAIVLARVEMNGFKVNQMKLQEIGKYFLEKVKDAEKEIYEMVGFEFNVASPKQLGSVLFETLNLGKGKKTKTGYSTSAEVLENLALIHPVPKKVLEYRKYAKLYSTYVAGLSEVIHKDGKVHTIFKQALTQTGRLSSTEPNIQNIPVRTEEGRMIRDVFIPSNDTNYLVSADYSQIELRVLASASKCSAMIETFNNGIDLHASTAAKIYNVPVTNVTKEQRRVAKAVNFGIVYGMSDWGLAEELHISPIEASNFIKKYFEVFPEIKPYLDGCITSTKELGYTTTLYNRRRYMPEINSSNGALRKFSERASMNAPIQGTAADIMKMAMVNVQKELDLHTTASYIVAQVHDELIVDADFTELEIVQNILKETMESVAKLDVKLSVDVEFGKTWDLK